jgi:hypothetical protein
MPSAVPGIVHLADAGHETPTPVRVGHSQGCPLFSWKVSAFEIFITMLTKRESGCILLIGPRAFRPARSLIQFLEYCSQIERLMIGIGIAATLNQAMDPSTLTPKKKAISN